MINSVMNNHYSSFDLSKNHWRTQHPCLWVATSKALESMTSNKHVTDSFGKRSMQFW